MKSCPYCTNNGCLTVADEDGEPEQEQCEFCYTEPDSVFNVVEALRSRVAKLEAAGDGLYGMVIKRNHYHQYTCELCDCYADTIAEIVHDPDCPVTLWESAKAGEG